MKHYRLITSFVLMMCVFSSTTKSQSIFDGKAHEIPKKMWISDCSGSNYSWIKKGDLTKYYSPPISKDVSYYHYVPNDGSIEIITDSTLASVSEILDKENIRDFDVTTLKYIIGGLLLQSMAGSDNYVIDKQYVEAYEYNVDIQVQSKKDLEKLESLLKANKNEGIHVQYDDKKWKAILYIATPRSGVEQLIIYGSTTPLSVEKMERIIIFKNNHLPLIVR